MRYDDSDYDQSDPGVKCGAYLRTIYCDSSTVDFNVIDDLLSSTGTDAYHLTRSYNSSDVVIEGKIPGTLKRSGLRIVYR